MLFSSDSSQAAIAGALKRKFLIQLTWSHKVKWFTSANNNDDDDDNSFKKWSLFHHMMATTMYDTLSYIIWLYSFCLCAAWLRLFALQSIRCARNFKKRIALHNLRKKLITNRWSTTYTHTQANSRQMRISQERKNIICKQKIKIWEEKKVEKYEYGEEISTIQYANSQASDAHTHRWITQKVIIILTPNLSGRYFDYFLTKR